MAKKVAAKKKTRATKTQTKPVPALGRRLQSDLTRMRSDIRDLTSRMDSIEEEQDDAGNFNNLTGSRLITLSERIDSLEKAEKARHESLAAKVSSALGLGGSDSESDSSDSER